MFPVFYKTYVSFMNLGIQEQIMFSVAVFSAAFPRPSLSSPFVVPVLSFPSPSPSHATNPSLVLGSSFLHSYFPVSRDPTDIISIEKYFLHKLPRRLSKEKGKWVPFPEPWVYTTKNIFCLFVLPLLFLTLLISRKPMFLIQAKTHQWVLPGNINWFDWVTSLEIG